jgi:hypothetical protein
MKKQIIRTMVAVFFLLALFQITDGKSNNMKYKLVDVKNVSRYYENRIAYQQVERPYIENKVDKEDNSIACLLIIRETKVYLFKDGYDNPKYVDMEERRYNVAYTLIDKDLWLNKIDNKPDFLTVADRKIEVFQRIDTVNKEGAQPAQDQSFVSTNYAEYYKKVRDSFLKRHTEIYKSLVLNRTDSNLIYKRELLPMKLYSKDYDPRNQKYYLSIKAYSPEGTYYFAEDSDGDGVTETFIVSAADGFNWGSNSGPNLVFIVNNSQDEIKAIIGDLVKNAYHGYPEEREKIKTGLPKTEDVDKMIEDLYHQNKFIEEQLKKSYGDSYKSRTVTE